MRTPQSEPAKRIALLYGRRFTTEWSPKEIRVFLQLKKAHCFDTMGDLGLIERYYISERRKGDKGVHRRDLATLLNNWQGELDRARAWEEKHPGKSAVSQRLQPAGWSQFLESTYPTAPWKDFFRVSGDVQREFREWEKQ